MLVYKMEKNSIFIIPLISLINDFSLFIYIVFFVPIFFHLSSFYQKVYIVSMSTWPFAKLQSLHYEADNGRVSRHGEGALMAGGGR